MATYVVVRLALGFGIGAFVRLLLGPQADAAEYLVGVLVVCAASAVGFDAPGRVAAMFGRGPQPQPRAGAPEA